MGYNTRYDIKADPWPEGLDKAIETHEEMSCAMQPDGDSEEPSKWYEHEQDMRALSVGYPGVHFTLRGEGEEAGDIWEKHFVDGRMQVCKAEIVIPPFNPAKLE